MPFADHRKDVVLAAIILVAIAARAVAVDDPLPSWNDGPAKQAIADFVARVTTEGRPDFVRPTERIAVFDNDGTLWCEQPMYTQFVFIADRVRELAPQHPEWKTTQPFQAMLEGDMKAVGATGLKGMLEMGMATHAGMSTEAFHEIVSRWITTAKHPRFKRLYTECVYQPQLEFLAYLRANGFKTFIVSGGGIEFMRPWTERVYDIPPEQVVGSSIVTEYQLQDGKPILMRLPKINFVDDKTGKPIGIDEHIGRRPILAVGNSDGDFEMLEWTTAGQGARLGMLVHHTDAEREYAYDRDSHVGQLARGLDEAPKRGWILIDMKNDWKTVFRN